MFGNFNYIYINIFSSFRKYNYKLYYFNLTRLILVNTLLNIPKNIKNGILIPKHELTTTSFAKWDSDKSIVIKSNITGNSKKMYTDQIRKLNNVFEKKLGLSITTSPDALELGNADIYIHFHNRGGEIFLNTIFGLVSKKFGLSKNSLIEKYGTILGKSAVKNRSVE